jgi:hypothetical protein
MPKPPLRRGLDPLMRIGLIQDPLSWDEDSFFRFVVFCEMLYRENLALKNRLRQCKVDPEKYLKSLKFPLGSPGPHRTVFDGWYDQIAKDLRARIAKQASRQPS